MLENLKTTHYSDGSPIAEMEDKTQWVNAGQSKTAAWCYYDNSAGNNPTCGKLYNWYAVSDPHHICPTGWHVPTDAEFSTLTDYLGGDQVAAGKMKATAFWNGPNTGADNSSGFTGIPTGYRANAAIFGSFEVSGGFWSLTEVSITIGLSRYLGSYSAGVYRSKDYKDNGLSVRCVAD